MQKIFFALAAVLLLCGSIFAFFAFFWPAYQSEGVVASPDARHSLVILREDRAAIDDFRYSVYCFPAPSQPHLQSHAAVFPLRTWLWRSNLIYAGYDFAGSVWETATE